MSNMGGGDYMDPHWLTTTVNQKLEKKKKETHKKTKRKTIHKGGKCAGVARFCLQSCTVEIDLSSFHFNIKKLMDGQ